MRPEEIVNARIDALHAGVNPAVRHTDGAQFALMLSMISASQDWAQQLALRDPGSDSGGEPAAAIVDRSQLYTPEMAGEMARALQEGRTGDLQMQLSWLDSVPLQRRPGAVSAASVDSAAVPLSQAAVLAKRYDLVGEVRQSRVQLAA
ncbi:MAG: hypothetical protein V7629_16405 [Motiliproteus sp.]